MSPMIRAPTYVESVGLTQRQIDVTKDTRRHHSWRNIYFYRDRKQSVGEKHIVSSHIQLIWYHITGTQRYSTPGLVKSTLRRCAIEMHEMKPADLPNPKQEKKGDAVREKRM